METNGQRRLPPGWAVMVTALGALAVLTAAPRLGQHADPPALPSSAAAEALPSTNAGVPTTQLAATPSTAARPPVGDPEAGPPAPGPVAGVTASAPASDGSPTRTAAVTPVSAAVSRRWATSGFLASGTSTSASYAIPAGPSGRQFTLSTSGTGSLHLLGCGIDQLASGPSVAIVAEGCSLELALLGEGGLSFTIATETS